MNKVVKLEADEIVEHLEDEVARSILMNKVVKHKGGYLEKKPREIRCKKYLNEQSSETLER